MYVQVFWHYMQRPLGFIQRSLLRSLMPVRQSKRNLAVSTKKVPIMIDDSLPPAVDNADTLYVPAATMNSLADRLAEDMEESPALGDSPDVP